MNAAIEAYMLDGAKPLGVKRDYDGQSGVVGGALDDLLRKGETHADFWEQSLTPHIRLTSEVLRSLCTALRRESAARSLAETNVECLRNYAATTEEREAVIAARDFCRANHMHGFAALDALTSRWKAHLDAPSSSPDPR